MYKNLKVLLLILFLISHQSCQLIKSVKSSKKNNIYDSLTSNYQLSNPQWILLIFHQYQIVLDFELSQIQNFPILSLK